MSACEIRWFFGGIAGQCLGTCLPADRSQGRIPEGVRAVSSLGGENQAYQACGDCPVLLPLVHEDIDVKCTMRVGLQQSDCEDSDYTKLPPGCKL